MEKSWPKNINRLPAKQNVTVINIIKNILSSNHDFAIVWRQGIRNINMRVHTVLPNKIFWVYTPTYRTSVCVLVFAKNCVLTGTRKNCRRARRKYFNTSNKIRTKYALKLNWKENRYGWHKLKDITK